MQTTSVMTVCEVTPSLCGCRQSGVSFFFFLKSVNSSVFEQTDRWSDGDEENNNNETAINAECLSCSCLSFPFPTTVV